MKVAIPTTHPDMHGRVGNLEDSPYLLIADIDMHDLESYFPYEESGNPLLVPDIVSREVALMLRLVDLDVRIVLVAQCDWDIPVYLGRAGIQLIAGMEGDAQSALVEFKQYCLFQTDTISHKALEN